MNSYLSSSHLRSQQKNRSLEIADSYLHGEIEITHATKRLSQNGSIGNLIAGELLLERAAKGGSRSSFYYVDLAGARLKQASSPKIEEKHDSYMLPSEARAIMRLSQLAVFSAMLSEGALPLSPLTDGMYKKLVKFGTVLVNAMDMTGPNDRDRSATELRGILTEMAVLILAQRTAIQELKSPEIWLPLQSYFSEDHGGDCLEDTGDQAWDMSIFTQQSHDQGVERSYTLQVKTYMTRDSIPTTPTVYLNPDLALSIDDRHTDLVQRNIIQGCARELVGDIDEAGRTGLSMRSNKLMDILDQQS